MKLHGYWRSGATYRLRNALNLKGLSYEVQPVNLLEGDQSGAAHKARSPMGLVPALELDDGTTMFNSEAIIAWLEETYPKPPLLPTDPALRRQARAFCATIGAEVQPLGNLRVLKYLKSELGAEDAAVKTWGAHWIETAFDALEPMAEARGTRFIYSDAPGLAEVYLVPQVYAAARFGVDMKHYPRLAEVVEACNALDAFKTARPDNQPDAPKE